MFTKMDGTFRKPRSYAGFRGTPRYVSLTVHLRRETGPRDDLIGWFYSMIELVNGNLPWSNLTAMKDIENAKKNETLEKLCKNQPTTTLQFAKYITALNTTIIPNYEEIYTMFKTNVGKLSVNSMLSEKKGCPYKGLNLAKQERMNFVKCKSTELNQIKIDLV
uniref:Protein kinase domain-containing protein n=1 Tax=Setaria digitata TaxID=48799 RepID=A0A915PHU2_9BILA